MSNISKTVKLIAQKVYQTSEPFDFNDRDEVTEEDIKQMGYVPGGKLYVAEDDSSIFVLLTNDGYAISLVYD